MFRICSLLARMLFTLCLRFCVPYVHKIDWNQKSIFNIVQIDFRNWYLHNLKAYQVLAPAIIFEVVRGAGTQWAAVRTWLALSRVPPQRLFPNITKTCQGLEFAGLSMVPPTIRSDSDCLQVLYYLNFSCLFWLR